MLFNEDTPHFLCSPCMLYVYVCVCMSEYMCVSVCRTNISWSGSPCWSLECRTWHQPWQYSV